MRVSFVIPSLNEREGIRLTLERIPRAELSNAGHEVEVIVVDGASKDGTADVARSLGATVINEARLGYGRAYKTGLAAARGDVIITGDADGSYPLEDAPQLLAQLASGPWDFFSTNRFAHLESGAMSAKHKFGNWVLSTLARLLFAIHVKDSQSGMWVIRRRVLDVLDLERMSDKMPFSEELKIRAFQRKELRSKEIPGKYRPRVGDVKLSSWKDGWRNLKHLVRLRFQRSPRRNGST